MRKVFIALFRGVNVGGNNKLPMKELKLLMEKEGGFADVTTYIQSGNVVFISDDTDTLLYENDHAWVIEMLVDRHFGFRPRVFVTSADFIARILNENPFRDYEHKGKAQHIFFFYAPPIRVDRELLDSLKTDSEAYEITDEVMYLYAPEGIGRSKMVEKLGRAIKADMTARNLNTVETLRDMAANLEE